MRTFGWSTNPRNGPGPETPEPRRRVRAGTVAAAQSLENRGGDRASREVLTVTARAGLGLQSAGDFSPSLVEIEVVIGRSELENRGGDRASREVLIVTARAGSGMQSARDFSRALVVIEVVIGLCELSAVAQTVGDLTWCEVWKLRAAGDVLPLEPALLQHPHRRCILRVAQCVQSPDAQIPGHVYHCAQGLGSVTGAPRFFSQDIAGRSRDGTLETQARAAKQLVARTRFDQIRTGGPPLPFRVTVSQKGPCLLDRSVPRPTQEPGHFGHARITREYRFGIRGSRLSQHQS